MRYNAVNAKEEAEKRGLIPLQVDGIPEGFSFIQPERTMNGVVLARELIAFVPLTDRTVSAWGSVELAYLYNQQIIIRDGKK